MNNIKNNTTMELHYILDYAMRNKENASYGVGYEIDNKKYDRYMSNEGWERYLALAMILQVKVINSSVVFTIMARR